jgi:branched-chain amino acid transport system ATP-binding protein
MLELSELETGYGKKQVVFGLSLAIHESEIVALIGPNGSGKSTVLKAICGLLPVWNGRINFNGSTINGSSPARNISLGLTYSPQGKNVFTYLSVAENLGIGGINLPRKEAKERIVQMMDFFPVLKERAQQEAGKLSGGEQQMLALAMALIPKPKLLMLDEPSLGLSPNLVNIVFDKVTELKEEFGVSVLLVEQKVREALNICDRVYSMKLGKLSFDGRPEELKENKEKLKQLFL